jgi:hypothetical protein
MEPSTTELVIEDKKKPEISGLLTKAHFAGNVFVYDEDAEYSRPPESRDVFMVELDLIKDFVQYLPYLPDGFGFSGGVARNALLLLLGESPPDPRDVDVEGVSELAHPKSNDQIPLLKEHTKRNRNQVSEEFPPGKNRDLVTLSPDLLEYFNTRDFSINEVFLYGNKLYFTRAAFDDIKTKTVRPTWYQKDMINYYGSINPQILIRSLLFQMDFNKSYGRGELSDIKDWYWAHSQIKSFDIALGLEKAFQKESSLEFLALLFEHQIVDKNEYPDGISDTSLHKLQYDLLRDIQEDPNERREISFSDQYFSFGDIQISESIDRELDQILCKISSRATRHRHISPDDLNY